MGADSDDVTREAEEPKVFRIAQIDVPGGSAIDRRMFVKATAASVGVAATVTMFGGSACTPEPDDDTSTEPIEPAEPAEPVEPSDEVTAAVVECECDTVCTCEAVCSCDGDCSCDSVCACEYVCTCEGDCTCDSVGGSHYWYPS